jgi:shikimate kinase
MNVFLIGYRATGKTSTGKLLAEMLAWPFVDTDSELAIKLGMSITDFINEHGWQAFRDQEKTIVNEVCKHDIQVVATGGGVALDKQNVKCMRQNGIIIWLQASPKTIKERLGRDKVARFSRPALTSLGLIEEVEETLNARRPLYEAAMHFSLQTDQSSIEEICNLAFTRLVNEFLQ